MLCWLSLFWIICTTTLHFFFHSILFPSVASPVYQHTFMERNQRIQSPKDLPQFTFCHDVQFQHRLIVNLEPQRWTRHWPSAPKQEMNHNTWFLYLTNLFDQIEVFYQLFFSLCHFIYHLCDTKLHKSLANAGDEKNSKVCVKNIRISSNVI